MVPARSTVARIIKEQKGNPPDGFKEDVPFDWTTMGTVPWEGSRPVLDLVAHHLSLGDVANRFTLTVREAKWFYRVWLAIGPGQALPDSDDEEWCEPEFRDLVSLATEYSYREVYSAVTGKPADFTDLTYFLAFQPFRNLTRFRKYQEARDRLGAFPFLTYLSLTDEYVDIVDPKIGMKMPGIADLFKGDAHTYVSTIFRDSHKAIRAIASKPGIPNPDEASFDWDLVDEWWALSGDLVVRANDGLTLSQLGQLSRWTSAMFIEVMVEGDGGLDAHMATYAEEERASTRAAVEEYLSLRKGKEPWYVRYLSANPTLATPEQEATSNKLLAKILERAEGSARGERNNG